MKRKWQPGQKEKAEAKFAEMQTKNMDYHGLYRESMVIVDQHEDLVNMLTEVYSAWYHNISSKGQQPKEMMSMQALELQKIFTLIYDTIEPLKLEINQPEGYKPK